MKQYDTPAWQTCILRRQRFSSASKLCRTERCTLDGEGQIKLLAACHEFGSNIPDVLLNTWISHKSIAHSIALSSVFHCSLARVDFSSALSLVVPWTGIGPSSTELNPTYAYPQSLDKRLKRASNFSGVGLIRFRQRVDQISTAGCQFELFQGRILAYVGGGNQWCSKLVEYLKACSVLPPLSHESFLPQSYL